MNPFGFGKLKYITAVDESKRLNNFRGPCIIISASGMCEFGRILHHLKNNIEDDKNTILLVGYQAENTLGRKIKEKQKIVNIFGEPYHLRSEVISIEAFSAHADRSDLIDYIGRVEKIKKIFLVHGEKEIGAKFMAVLNENGYKDVNWPTTGETFDLT